MLRDDSTASVSIVERAVSFYYLIKGLIPRRLQVLIRSLLVREKRRRYKRIWPISRDAKRKPFSCFQWPENKRFAFILTHDVDTAIGYKNCFRLLDLEKKHGFRSSFNFVLEDYHVAKSVREKIRAQGFEVGIHGLKHDGKLYKSRQLFHDSAVRINAYLGEWGSVGFRSPSMQHNLEWIHELDIEYDSSTFDTDPFEPQPDGMNTIYPFWVKNPLTQKGYVEMPYTLPQDFTLFILLKERSIRIWKEKLDWIAENGGMALLNTHPDYIGFKRARRTFSQYPVEFYEELLNYVNHRYKGAFWHVLPKEIAMFWRKEPSLHQFPRPQSSKRILPGDGRDKNH